MPSQYIYSTTTSQNAHQNRIQPPNSKNETQYFDSLISGPLARAGPIGGLNSLTPSYLNPVTGLFQDLALPRKDRVQSSGSGNLYSKSASFNTNDPKQNDELYENKTHQFCQDLEKLAFEANSNDVNELLEKYGSKLPIKALNTALRAAVKGAKTLEMEETLFTIDGLVKAGANINSEEADQGKTALMMACEKGYMELVGYILELNALVDHRD